MDDESVTGNSCPDWSNHEAPPVLLTGFNRPQMMADSLERLRRIRPIRLYVALDGPRDHRDVEACREVSALVDSVDWCDPRILARPSNLGCGVAVSSAIDWFFSHEAAGIILEDDCIPDPSFFPFCDELLNRYENDARVLMVSGNQFDQDRSRESTSYRSTQVVHCWGWATWRRAWESFDFNMAEWPQRRREKWLMRVGHGNRVFAHVWERRLNEVQVGRVDTWDYQWAYSVWLQGGLSLEPTKNLVTNVGFGPDATHTTGGSGDLHAPATARMEFPLVHPTELVPASDDDLKEYNWIALAKSALSPRLRITKDRR